MKVYKDTDRCEILTFNSKRFWDKEKEADVPDELWEKYLKVCKEFEIVEEQLDGYFKND